MLPKVDCLFYFIFVGFYYACAPDNTGTLAVNFREYSDNFREHSVHSTLGNIQSTLGNIQSTSGNFQSTLVNIRSTSGTFITRRVMSLFPIDVLFINVSGEHSVNFREHSVNFRELSVNFSEHSVYFRNFYNKKSDVPFPY
jgi:hypothetical protein